MNMNLNLKRARMKKVVFIVMLALTMAFVTIKAHATPVYYDISYGQDGNYGSKMAELTVYLDDAGIDASALTFEVPITYIEARYYDTAGNEAFATFNNTSTDLVAWGYEPPGTYYTPFVATFSYGSFNAGYISGLQPTDAGMWASPYYLGYMGMSWSSGGTGGFVAQFNDSSIVPVWSTYPTGTKMGFKWPSVSGPYAASTNPVPEPSTMLLLGSGLVGMVLYRRRRGKA